MTVKMTSDVNRLTGVTNTIIADWGDITRFDSDGSQVRLTFKGGVTEVALSGYVRSDELENRSKYWKTDELIKQLEGWSKWLEDARDRAKQGNSNIYLQNALNYEAQASALRTLIANLRAGDEVWQD